MKQSTLLCIFLLFFQLGTSQTSIELNPDNRAISSQDVFSNQLKDGAVFNPNIELFSTETKASRDLIVYINMPYGKQEKLILDKKKIATTDFELYLKSQSSKRLLENNDNGSHYRGKVNGYDKSIANLSIFGDEIIGMIVIPGHGTFNLGLLKTPTKDNYSSILYAIENLNSTDPFHCGSTADILPNPVPLEYSAHKKRAESCKAVRLYIEFDYYTYKNVYNRNLTRTTNYANALLNNVFGLYENDEIRILVSEMVIWTSPDGYPTETSPDALLDFTSQVQDDFDGDVATLVSTAPESNGGLAFVNILCVNYNPDQGYGRTSYCNTVARINDIPTYSWDVNVVTHEIGHNLGSPHTHDCFWNGDFTPIDDCAGTADSRFRGNCDLAPLPNEGTIMSYCHLLNDIRISFIEGFGPQPSDQIQQRIEDSPCITEQSLVNTEITTPDERLCKGDTVTIFVDEGYTYKWLGGSTESSLTISSSGSYRVTVYDANLCSEIYQKDVLFFNGPRNKLSYNDTLACDGDSLVINTENIRGPSNFTWSDNSMDTSFTAFNTQDIHLTITDTFGCTTNLDLSVRFKSLPELFFHLEDSLGICTGEQASIVAYGGNELRFTPNLAGNMDSTYTALAGKYTIETERDGCISQDSFEIFDLGRPIPMIAENYSICSDDSLIIFAGAEPDTNIIYIWNSQDTSFSNVVSESGMHQLQYINQYGCDTTIELIISTVELPETSGLIYNYVDGDTTYTISIEHLNDLFGTITWQVDEGNIISENEDNIIVRWLTENDSSLVCVTIEVDDDITCTQEYCINVPTEIMTDINEFNLDQLQISNSPNPFNELISINYQVQSRKAITVEVLNILGQNIFSSSVKPSSNTGFIDIKTSQWADGAYMIIVKQGKLSKTFKSIKIE